MAGHLAARIRALALTCGVALAAALAGCTNASTTAAGVTATGKTLRIYVSVPASAAADRGTQDVVAAERLAFSQLSGNLKPYTLQLRVLANNKPSDTARAAIEDSSSIAYLGEVVPGTSGDSGGITNAEDLLQVSPTDTAIQFTIATSAVPGAPTRYYEDLKDYKRTFARVVPNGVREAQALVREMRSLTVKRLYVTNDGGQYGKALAVAINAAAAAAGVSVVSTPAQADGAFYGGGSPQAAATAFNRLGAGNAKLKLFGPSALSDQRFAAALEPSLRNVFVSVPGLLAAKLSADARKNFAAPFQRTYHHAPAPQAIFGYEAMAAVLAVLHEDGSLANQRSKVVHDFFAIANRASVLGTYSIDANGDTNIAPFVIERPRGGQLTAFASVQ